eukprot:6214824-Pleurochrysis_carterae.AAC.5
MPDDKTCKAGRLGKVIVLAWLSTFVFRRMQVRSRMRPTSPSLHSSALKHIIGPRRKRSDEAKQKEPSLATACASRPACVLSWPILLNQPPSSYVAKLSQRICHPQSHFGQQNRRRHRNIVSRVCGYFGHHACIAGAAAVELDADPAGWLCRF